MEDWPAVARKYPEAMRLVAVEALRVIVMRLEGRVMENKPAGVGGDAGLRGSINGQVRVPFGDVLEGAVGSPLAYAAPVEYGTKPHFPPVAPLELWCRRVLGLDAQEARSVAFAIAIKISKKGTEGAHMFEKTMKELAPWIESELRDIPAKVGRRVGA